MQPWRARTSPCVSGREAARSHLQRVLSRRDDHWRHDFNCRARLANRDGHLRRRIPERTEESRAARGPADEVGPHGVCPRLEAVRVDAQCDLARLAWCHRATEVPPEAEGPGLAPVRGAQTGISYSQSQTVCPNSFDAANLDTTTTSPSFGSVWNGPAVRQSYRGTESVDLLHSPSDASLGATLWAYEHWIN